jgi:PAS domain S-box-containing protein
MSDPLERSSSERDRERARALHESAEQLGEMGSWEWAIETDELIWSDNHFRLFGLEPNALEPTPEFVIEHTHADDREHVAKEVERLRAGGKAQPFEYRIVRRDGVVRHLRSTRTELQARPRRVTGYVQDITEVRLAEREIQSHIAVADAFGRWESLERSGEQLLRALGEAMGFAAAAIWLPQEELLVARVFWQAVQLDPSSLETEIRGSRVPRDSGLPGQVWVSRRPASLVEVVGDPSSAVQPAAALAGLRAAVAFPALKQEEVLAVLEFYSQEEFALTDRLMQSLIGIGRELGHILDRRRGELGPPPLSPRELEVLQLAAGGHAAPEIAETLVVSQDTIKTHFKHIYSKFDVNDRAAAVAHGLRLGLIE